MTGVFEIKRGDKVRIKQGAIDRIRAVYNHINQDVLASRIFTVRDVLSGFIVDTDGNRSEGSLRFTTEEAVIEWCDRLGSGVSARYIFGEDEIDDDADILDDFNIDEFDSILCDFLAYQ